MVQEEWALTVFGDNGVGRTALAWRGRDTTVDESPRKQLIVDNNVCTIDVLDPPAETSAEDRDRWIRPSGGDAVFLVYSVTSRASFASVEAYWKALCRMKGENAPLMLLGNKCDDGVGRAVSQKEGEALTQRLGCPFLEVSAKTGLNVEQAFVDMVRLLRDPEKGVPDRNVVRMEMEGEEEEEVYYFAIPRACLRVPVMGEISC
ncbi:P-loop containing nucleoside triphosphate hydrolase protein [Mycena vulgaris]|nr:P-loop containing nucleoside triphosphate hydrolase protein [Mycena vulgaris]